MMRRVVCGVGVLLLTVASRAGDVAAYRGLQNDGIYDETGLLQAWPAEGPKFLWKSCQLGVGYGGVSVADGIVWVTGGGSGTLFGFTLDGELKHKYPFGSTTWKRFSGARFTPLVRDGVGIVVRPDAGVYAMDLATGQKRWTVNAWKGFGSGKGDMGWGYPSSAPTFDENLILNPVSRDDVTPPVVAVDFATGKTVWEADPGRGKRYSCGDHSASVFRHEGRWLNVNPTWRYILCLDPLTGERLWEIPDPDADKGSEKVLTPVYGGGYLLYDQAGMAVCARLGSRGETCTPVWMKPFGGYAHAVILGRRAYLAGSATDAIWSGAALSQASARPAPPVAPPRPKNAPPLPPLPGGLACLDLETGIIRDVLRLRDGLGHVVAADGSIYVQDYDANPKHEEGLASLGLNEYLVKPTATGMEVMGRFRLPVAPDDAKVRDLEWQANVPQVIAHGRLFVRYGPVWAYDLRPESNGPPADSLPLPVAALWDLWLRGFPEAGRDLLVVLDVKDGVVASAGVAFAPGWNRAVHVVKALEAKVEGDALAGRFSVTLHSDGSIPEDRQPVTREVSLDVRHARGNLAGRFKIGESGGAVDGRVTAK